jgi:hypothetical protein
VGGFDGTVDYFSQSVGIEVIYSAACLVTCKPTSLTVNRMFMNVVKLDRQLKAGM